MVSAIKSVAQHTRACKDEIKFIQILFKFLCFSELNLKKKIADSGAMSFVDEFLMITYGTVRVRILEHDGRHGFVHFRHLIQVGDTHIESHGLRPCYNASDCLRMQFVRQQENFSPVLPVK